MQKYFSNPNGRVLVAVTLDESAGPLIRLASQLANRTRRGLTVLHVCDYWIGRTWANDLMLGGAVMTDLAASAELEALQNAKTELQKLVASNAQCSDVKSEVTTGFPDESIRAHAVTNAAEVIVLGGSTAEYRFVPSGLSTTLGLLSDAPCPVIVVPKAWDGTLTSERLKLLIADDLTTQSEVAVNAGFLFAAALGSADVIHTHANQLTKDALGTAMTTAAAAAHTPTGAFNKEEIWEAAMSSLMKKLTSRSMETRNIAISKGCKVTEKVLHGDPLDTLIECANSTKPDMLVFGRHRTWRKKPFSVGQMPFHGMLKSGRPVMVVG